MGRPRTAKGRARETVAVLSETYPGSARELCALVHDNPFQLLVATILSAQCTDERVNLVTPALFARYPDAEALAGADIPELEAFIRPTGFFHAKAASLTGMARALVERHGGEVPRTMDELNALPGVGRKTANVILSVAFDLPGLPVDTHVLRLSHRLGLSLERDPEKVERDVCALVPRSEWGGLSLRLILHGRAICQARSPKCPACVLGGFCPSFSLLGTVVAPRAKSS